LISKREKHFERNIKKENMIEFWRKEGQVRIIEQMKEKKCFLDIVENIFFE
jgi:hypothetical protein